MEAALLLDFLDLDGLVSVSFFFFLLRLSLPFTEDDPDGASGDCPVVEAAGTDSGGILKAF